MKNLGIAVIVLALLCSPDAFAGDDQWSLLVSAQYFEKTGEDEFETSLGVGAIDVDFEGSPAIGFGLTYSLSEQWWLELRTSAAKLDGQVFIQEGDAISILLINDAIVYPINLSLQYHFRKEGDWHPYLGAGAGVVSIRRAAGLKFDEDYGLVLGGGVDVEVFSSWDVNLDVRYIPLETGPDVRSRSGSAVGQINLEPVIYSAGLRYRF